jgi:hypothetical protein
MQLKVELTDKDFVVRNAETKEIIKRGTKREIEDFLDHLENLENHLNANRKPLLSPESLVV